MNPHLADRDVLALLRGDLPADRAARAVAHLQSCGACASSARSHPSVVRSAAGLTALLGDAAHPDVDTTLTGYVDTTLPAEERAGVESHLAECARCREDVADLRVMAAALRPPRRSARLWLAAAAVVAIAILGMVVWGRRTPAPPPAIPAASVEPRATPAVAPKPPPPRYARSEWADAVNDAVHRGVIAMPAALAELQVASDELRGPGEERITRLDPAAEIVEETRPLFRWPAEQGATYVVSVFDRHELVAESGVLSASRWRPERELARGPRYHWEVEVRCGEERIILPAPPAPPAFFRILDRTAHDDLERARQHHGSDPLLLGILYARYGLRDAALRELTKVPSADGQRLRRSVEEWP
jgi:anti-sigma factor RsiW